MGASRRTRAAEAAPGVPRLRGSKRLRTRWPCGVGYEALSTRTRTGAAPTSRIGPTRQRVHFAPSARWRTFPGSTADPALRLTGPSGRLPGLEGAMDLVRWRHDPLVARGAAPLLLARGRVVQPDEHAAWSTHQTRHSLRPRPWAQIRTSRRDRPRSIG